MAMDADDRTAMATTTVSNKITLDQALANEFITFQKNIRSNTVDMALRAFEIRSQYLSADGRQYDAAFERWWTTHELDSIFGKRANFTKWAASGAALEKAKFNKYSERMPTTQGALYEVSQLTPDEITLCLENRFTRKSLTDKKKGLKHPVPLINPEVSAGSIKSWRERWRNPPVKSNEKRSLPYATMKIHGSLYDFDKQAKATGILTVEKLKEINDTLTNAMMPYDAYVLLETKLDQLIEGATSRQEKAEEQAAKKAESAAKKKSEKKPKP